MLMFTNPRIVRYGDSDLILDQNLIKLLITTTTINEPEIVNEFEHDTKWRRLWVRYLQRAVMDVCVRECLYIFHHHCIFNWIQSNKPNCNKCPNIMNKKLMSSTRMFPTRCFGSSEYEQVISIVLLVLTYLSNLNLMVWFHYFFVYVNC